MIKITSSNNDKFKLLKKIAHSASQRRKMNLYIIEGLKIVQEAIMSSQSILQIVVNDEGAESLKNLNISSETEVVFLDDDLFKIVSDTVNSQGIIALMNIKEYNLKKLKHKRALLIDQVQDPGNLGTLIRSADAFNFDVVISLKGSCDIYNPKTVRSTMGSLFHIPIIKDVTNREIYDFLKLKNTKIYATNLSKESIEINKVKVNTPFAIVIGNESKGVSEFWKKASDYNIIIPIRGKAESLNAGVAGSIAMYQFSCLV